MKNIGFAIAALAALGASSASAATVDICDTYAGQAFDVTSDLTPFAPGDTYTLSADFAFTNSAGAVRIVRLPKGAKTVFDFSNGNHVLKCGGARMYGGGGTVPYEIDFVGGTWDVGGGNMLLCGWSSLSGANVTYTFDGVVITNVSTAAQIINGYGTNQNFIVKGGSRYYGSSNYIDLCPATPDDTAAGAELGRLVEFSGGSRFYAGTAAVFDNRNTVATRAQNTTIRFTGVGTVATGTEAGGAGNCDFYFGYLAPASRLEVLDGALFDFRYLHVGGYYNENNGSAKGGATSCSNSVLVADGGELRTKNGLSIGEVPGADHNSVLVDAGKFTTDPTSAVHVGHRSSFNSLTMTNGTVTARDFRIGYEADANSNVLHIAGANAVLNITSYATPLFALGRGNLFLLDDGASYGSSSVDFVLSDSQGVVATTGNTVRVEGGATLNCRYARMLTSDFSTGNTLIVSGGSIVDSTELTMAKQASVGGNTLVVSNATVNYRASYGFHCSGTGNVCRIAGGAPKIRYVGDASGDGIATLRYGVELQFDMTGVDSAYDEPVFLVPWFQMNEGVSLTFNGLEELSERLDGRADFVLVRLTSTSHLLSKTINADVFQAASAALPKNCRLSLESDGTELVLHVRPASRGMTITIW